MSLQQSMAGERMKRLLQTGDSNNLDARGGIGALCPTKLVTHNNAQPSFKDNTQLAKLPITGNAVYNTSSNSNTSLPINYKDYVQLHDFHAAARVVDNAYNIMSSIHSDSGVGNGSGSGSGGRPSMTWQHVSTNSCEYQPQALSFTGHSPGPTQAQHSDTPLQILRRILDPVIVSMIIDEMNAYGRRIINDEVSVGPKKKKQREENQASSSGQSCSATLKTKKIGEWIVVDEPEFWRFMSVMFYMSVVKIPTLKRYWNKDLWGQPTVQSLMRRDRFCALLRSLEFADVSDSYDYSNLKRIFPLLDKLCFNFQKEYQAECHLSLEETMIKSNGKFRHDSSAFSEETSQVGIRSHILCESKSGYVLNIIVDDGANNAVNSYLSSKLNTSLSSELAVCRLLSPYRSKGHVLCTDQYYSLPHLFGYLKGHYGLDCIGLVNPDTDGFPAALCPSENDIGKGDVASMVSRVHDTSLLAQTWRLKEDGPPKHVSILSTKHPAATKVVSQKHKGYLHKPVCYLDYADHNNAITKVDQTYPQFPGEDAPSHKYPYKLFLRFLHLAIHNAFVIWRHFDPKPNLGYGCNFRLQVMKELKLEADLWSASTPSNSSNLNTTMPKSVRKKLTAGSAANATSADAASRKVRHTLSKTVVLMSGGPKERRSRRRCFHCWTTSNKRTQTTFECQLCNQGFCPPCFHYYHTKLRLL